MKTKNITAKILISFILFSLWGQQSIAVGIRGQKSSFCAPDLIKITKVTAEKLFENHDINSENLDIKYNFTQGRFKISPFVGLRNLVLDRPTYWLSSYIAKNKKVTGPWIRKPYKFASSLFVFLVLMYPVDYGFDYLKANRIYQEINITFPNKYDRFVFSDIRFSHVKNNLISELDLLSKSKLDDETKGQKLKGILEGARRKAFDVQEKIYQFFLARSLSPNETLASKGNLYFTLLESFPEALLINGVTPVPGQLTSSKRIEEPLLSDTEILKLLENEYVLAFKLQAVYELVFGVDARLVKPEWHAVRKELDQQVAKLRGDSFVANLRATLKGQKDKQLYFIQEYEKQKTIFEHNEVLGVQNLKPIIAPSGQITWSDEVMTLKDVEEYLLDRAQNAAKKVPEVKK